MKLPFGSSVVSPLLQTDVSARHNPNGLKAKASRENRAIRPVPSFAFISEMHIWS